MTKHVCIVMISKLRSNSSNGSLVKSEEPRSKKGGQVSSNVKVPLTVFFDLRSCMSFCHLVVHLIRSTTWTLDAIYMKHSEENNNHNAVAHTSLLLFGFLVKNNTLSSGVAPCNFFLFPTLKRIIIKTEDWKKCWHKFIISDGISLNK